MTNSRQLRNASHKRQTRETEIEVHLDLEGTGAASIDTGIGFIDHMLELLAHHSGFDLTVVAKGDLHIDDHHTVEDLGLVIGECLREALGERKGIERMGTCYVPLDEALTRAVVDLSGRPYLDWRVEFQTERVGQFATELAEDFFRALCERARMTVHLELIHGRNSHHIMETLFKATARSLRHAARRTGGSGVPSTKGTLTE